MAGKAAASAAPPQEPETPESDVATDVVTESDYQPQGASAKLSFIQSHITFVEKTGRNTHHNYDYFQEHGLLNIIRPWLRALHCSIEPSPTGVKYDRAGNSAYVVGWLDFVDGDEPPFVTDPTTGQLVLNPITGEPIANPDRKVRLFFTNEGVDSQDKATNKALTGWMKYALQKTFAIPTEQVDDADATEVREAAAAVGAPVAAKPIGAEKAEPWLAIVADLVSEGKLDGNKFKAKLATYRTNAVAELTDEQFAEFDAWVDAEVKKAAAEPEA